MFVSDKGKRDGAGRHHRDTAAQLDGTSTEEEAKAPGSTSDGNTEPESQVKMFVSLLWNTIGPFGKLLLLF